MPRRYLPLPRFAQIGIPTKEAEAYLEQLLSSHLRLLPKADVARVRWGGAVLPEGGGR